MPSEWPVRCSKCGATDLGWDPGPNPPRTAVCVPCSTPLTAKQKKLKAEAKKARREKLGR
jgi:hypothetical protein